MIPKEFVKEFFVAIIAIITIIAIGVVLFSWLEGWSPIDSLYYTVTTVFTVGFGDYVVSPENRVIAGFYILAFCTVTFACSSLIGQSLITFIHNRMVMKEIKMDIIKMSQTLEELKRCENGLCEVELYKLKKELQEIEDELVRDISKEY